MEREIETEYGVTLITTDRGSRDTLTDIEVRDILREASMGLADRGIDLIDVSVEKLEAEQ